MNIIAGYEFAIANNAILLPSAAGTQNEIPKQATAVCESDSEDAILIASGLLPRLIAWAERERERQNEYN